MADQIKIKNIYYMLSYAYQNLNEGSYKNIDLESFNNIHDLLSAILIRGTSNQIKRGLHRDYLSFTENTGRLKGKIDITESIKQQTMMNRKMVCHHDLFSEDTQLNQILKATMMLLLHHGNVSQKNKKLLRKLLLYFQNVTAVDPFHIGWNTVNYPRNSPSYKMLIHICQLIIKGLLLSTENGQYKLLQFLDDQQMYRLYEKFVLEYYKKEYPELNAKSSYIDWDIGGDGNKMFLPTLKSDITLTYGVRTLIIDTKYYQRSMQTHTLFDSTKLISGNLYQIFTYVKNKDKDNTGNVSGMLLYAKTNEDITPDNDYVMGGNHISIKTLNLNSEWENIKSQLDNIAVDLMCVSYSTAFFYSISDITGR